MEKESKQEKVFAAKWWNPLFWLLVVLAPFVGIVIGALGGAITGALIGYGNGLDLAGRKMEKIINKLP